MLKNFAVNTLNISKVVIYSLSIFFLTKVGESYAFGGASSMGFSGASSSAGSGTIKSGMSIVDPEGNAYNCEPFVDKRWESTSFEDNWNGVYFSLGMETSKFSGGFKVENSIPHNVSGFYPPINQPINIPVVSNIGSRENFSGSSSLPNLTVGGGFLIDRVYLATDFEIRAGLNEFTHKLKTKEINYDKNGEQTIEKETSQNLIYSLSNPIIFNAKIGYLLSKRSMLYFNAGVASFSSSDIKIDGDYIVKEANNNGTSPPIRLSLGGEYLLSNHFRITADYSYWFVPQSMGSFNLHRKAVSNNPSEIKNGDGTEVNWSENSFIADFKINSLKIGILYRF